MQHGDQNDETAQREMAAVSRVIERVSVMFPEDSDAIEGAFDSLSPAQQGAIIHSVRYAYNSGAIATDFATGVDLVPEAAASSFEAPTPATVAGAFAAMLSWRPFRSIALRQSTLRGLDADFAVLRSHLVVGPVPGADDPGHPGSAGVGAAGSVPVEYRASAPLPSADVSPQIERRQEDAIAAVLQRALRSREAPPIVLAAFLSVSPVEARSVVTRIATRRSGSLARLRQAVLANIPERLPPSDRSMAATFAEMCGTNGDFRDLFAASVQPKEAAVLAGAPALANVIPELSDLAAGRPPSGLSPGTGSSR